MLGGPPLYSEAVSAQLRSQGVEIIPTEPRDGDGGSLGLPEGVDAVLAYCESEDDWNRLMALGGHHVVAVLPDFTMSNLVRALASGACPVHLRTSSEIIVETARAAASGEALLPMGLAQRLAVKAQATEVPTGLDRTELKLVSALADNQTIPKDGARPQLQRPHYPSETPDAVRQAGGRDARRGYRALPDHRKGPRGRVCRHRSGRLIATASPSSTTASCGASA